VKTEDFERLYEAHAQGLYGFLAYRTGDATLAEDLVADTFERVLTSRRPFDRRKASEKTWIYSIALNRLRDLARRDAAETRALTRAEPAVINGNGHNGHNGMEHAETRQIIMAALTTLGDDEREALSLRYGADLSLSTIAKVIGVPRSTVESRIYKGLKHMRAELDGGRGTGMSFVGAREEKSA
jgi:RNA polymerase sigma-70 factor (ECF subfamily)